MDTSGVGYTRRIIQVFAEIIGLDRIFVIDDNLSNIYSVTESNQVSKTITLFSLLRALESQFECADFEFGDFRTSPEHLGCVCTESIHRLHQYTGPTMKYAILGIRKSRQNINVRVIRAFKNVHVYSLVLLNIKLLKEKNIRYKTRQVCHCGQIYICWCACVRLCAFCTTMASI